MTHLTSDQLIAAIDGTLDVNLHRHVAECALCRRQVDELAAALREAEAVEVPEPSPLFWDHLSARVRHAISADAAIDAPERAWPRWLRWPVVAPVAGVAVVIAVLAVTLSKSTGPLPVDVADAQSDVLLSDDGWTIVADALGEMDWETASEAGLFVEPGDVDRVVLELTADEQRALTALLQAELRAKS
jgi:hypothetical protein